MMVEDFPTYFPSCNFLFLFFFFNISEEWHKDMEEFLGFLKRVYSKCEVLCEVIDTCEGNMEDVVDM